MISCKVINNESIEILYYDKSTGYISSFYESYFFTKDSVFITNNLTQKHKCKGCKIGFGTDTICFKKEGVFTQLIDTLVPYYQFQKPGDTIINYYYKYEEILPIITYYKESRVVQSIDTMEDLRVISHTYKSYELSKKIPFDKKEIKESNQWRIRDHYSQNNLTYSVLYRGVYMNLMLINLHENKNDTTIAIVHQSSKRFKRKTSKILNKIGSPEGVPERALKIEKREWK